MLTQCSPQSMQFARLDGRSVVADFGGGALTSDAGSLLLGATDRAIGLVDRFAGCFSDGRAAGRVVHDVRSLIGQRVFGIALGYEDLTHHDELRRDPALGAVLVNFAKTYLTGAAPEFWLYFLGALFILVTILLPKGIAGLLGNAPGSRTAFNKIGARLVGLFPGRAL